MASNVTPFPRLPSPPQQIDPRYINDLVRTLEVVLTQLQNPQLNFQQVPSMGISNTFLQGDLYIADGGFLKLAAQTDIFSGSVSATTSVGTVTVAVS